MVSIKLHKDDEEIITLDRNFAMEAVRVTEAAALASHKWMGRGDEKAADAATPGLGGGAG